MTASRVVSKTELAQLLSECARNCPHSVPLVAAAHSGAVSVAWVARGHSAPLRMLDRAKAPAVVVVGDDFADGFDPGPAGWPGLPRVARWARLAVINATGGRRDHYARFVQFAVESRKMLLIETGTARADAWLDVLRSARVPTIVLRPEDGGVQPLMPDRGAMH